MDPVRISAHEATGLPFAGLARSESLIAAIGRRLEPKWVRISVYRSDPADEKPINVDHYTVLEGFPPDLDVWGLIQDATTDPGPNFERYRDDHVFFVKEEAGDDHWLATLPTEVVALIEPA